MRKKTIMNSRKSVDWMFQALMISMLLGISWKDKHKIRGDHGRLAKNPLMVKSVFLEFQFVWKCLNVLPSQRRVLILSEAVISPTVVEFERLGGNFRNRYGSYTIWPLFSTTVYWGNSFCSQRGKQVASSLCPRGMFRTQGTRPTGFTNGRAYPWTNMP